MSREQSDFHRKAASALYLQAALIGKLGLELDATAKQVEAAVVLKFAEAARAKSAEAEVVRLRHDLAVLQTTLETREATIAKLEEPL